MEELQKTGKDLATEYEVKLTNFSKYKKINVTFTNEDGYFGNPLFKNSYFLLNIQTVAVNSNTILHEKEVYGIVKNKELV